MVNYRFSANTGYLWQELPFLDRIRRAAAAGFEAVEFHDEAQRADLFELKDTVAEAGLPVLGINIYMGETTGSAAVAIGPGKSRFLRIASDQIEYVDASGETLVLQLPPTDGSPDTLYVGFRWLDKAPWTVRIQGDKDIAFAFESYEAAYELLLNPLGEAGRDTLDCT